MMGALRIPALPVQLSSTYKTDRYENKQRQWLQSTETHTQVVYRCSKCAEISEWETGQYELTVAEESVDAEAAWTLDQ